MSRTWYSPLTPFYLLGFHSNQCEISHPELLITYCCSTCSGKREYI